MSFRTQKEVSENVLPAWHSNTAATEQTQKTHTNEQINK